MSQLFCLFIKKILTCEIKWNKFYSENALMFLIAIAAISQQIFLNAIVSIEIEKI